MLGFPIRTPSDHSSVDSSPRLIAASYVLHRLLVPRHPPNALKHLQNKDARVHCAVLKQHTHSNRTPGLTDRTGSISENPSRSCLLPGKNACSFRTQQCVDISTSTGNTVPAVCDGGCQRSTHEQPPNHIRVRNGLCHNPHPPM